MITTVQSTAQSTGSSITNSLQDLYNKVASFIPGLIAAIIILIVGWIVASLLGKLVKKVLQWIKVDDLANRLGMRDLSRRVGQQITISGILGWLVKWFFLIFTFIAASEALGLSQVSQFIYNQVIPYFGNVILAAIILVIGFLAANFLYTIVRDSLRASGFGAADTVATLSKWALLIFSFIAALSQLKIAPDFMKLLFAAIVFMFALAGGLAFGLGGRQQASDALDALRKHKAPPPR